MNIDGLLATNTGVTGQNKTREEQSAGGFHDALLAAAQSGKKSIESDEKISAARKTYEEIVNSGFGKWVQEMRKEELEAKLREKILASMGLTEGDLGYMSADKITEIEKSIQGLMQQIMAEKGQDQAREQQEKGLAYVPVIPGAVG